MSGTPRDTVGESSTRGIASAEAVRAEIDIPRVEISSSALKGSQEILLSGGFLAHSCVVRMGVAVGSAIACKRGTGKGQSLRGGCCRGNPVDGIPSLLSAV